MRLRDDPAVRIAFVCFAAAAIVLLGIVGSGRGTPFGDFDKAYYPAGRIILTTPSRVYDCAHVDGLCFVNIPIVALLFAPLAFLSLPVAHAVVVVGSIATVFMVAVLLIKLSRAVKWRRYAVLALILLNGPLYYSVRLGNLTHVVLAAVLLAVWWLIRGADARGGALLALTAMIKPPLLIWLPYFALRRRWRAASGMIAMLLLVIAASIALYGVDLHLAWMRQFVAGASSRPVGAYNVQSIGGFLVRLTTSGTLVNWWPVDVSPAFWAAEAALVAAALVVSIGASALASTPRAPSVQLREFSMVLCVMLLVSPISWTHYYCLLLLPLATYITAAIEMPHTRGWQVGMAAAGLLVSLPATLWVPAHWLIGAVIARVLLSYYLFGAALLLSLLATAAVQARRMYPMVESVDLAIGTSPAVQRRGWA
jgi:hypothetical protein